MPDKSRSQYRENEDDVYRIKNTVALNRTVSKESDHVNESDSSESAAEATCSNKTTDATDNILPDGLEITKTDRSRDDTHITKSRVEWTAAKQALFHLIDETLSHDPVLRAWIIAKLDPIDNPEDFVAILQHPPSKCDLAELTTKSERKKRSPKWKARGMNVTVRDSDESNMSTDESLSDSESTQNTGKDIQSIVQGAKTSKMTETISSGSSTVLASSPTAGNAKDLQSVLMGMQELNIDLHMDKCNLVPMNDLDGKRNAEPNIGTPVKENNLSVRNEFDDAPSEDDDDDEDDASSDISIDVNASDESDDENYTTRGMRSTPYSSARPVARDKNGLVNYEYKSSNIKTVNKPVWNGTGQTKIYVLPGLVTPPSTIGDVNYQQGASVHQTNNGPLITQVYDPYSPVSISEDHPDLDACQSASNNGFLQNDVPYLDLQSELQDLYISTCVPDYHEPERCQGTASFSQSESVWSPDHFVDPIKDCSAEKNSFQHDGNADENNIQFVIMEVLKKLDVEQQKTLLYGYCDNSESESNSTICQILAELQTQRGETNAAGRVVARKASPQKVRDFTDPPRRPNRNPLTVKQIIDEKLQVSINPKIMNKMEADKLLARMAGVFELDDQVIMPVNNETVLMRLLKDSQHFKNNIELFVVLIERMTRIPSSFNNRDEQNRSALYLAAINFPSMPEIVGHLAKIMLEDDLQSETIRQLDETIIEVLSNGDTHIEVLKELLSLKRSGNKIFDASSYVSSEGKTMLQIAGDVETKAPGSAVQTIKLLERKARSTIRDYNASLDNGITRQSNDILSDLFDFQPGVTAEYVRYTPDTFGIAMISDQFKNRQIVM